MSKNARRTPIRPTNDRDTGQRTQVVPWSGGGVAAEASDVVIDVDSAPIVQRPKTKGVHADRPRWPRSLLSINEAAFVLGIGRTKAYELISRGELESVHIGRSVRVPSTAVEDFIARLLDEQARRLA